MENILEVKQLNFSYDKDCIFNDLQFSIKKESLSLILGSSSCGKTTLIRLLTGILPSKGQITLNDINLNKQTLSQYMLLFGVVFFDNEYQFLTESVIDELSFPLENLLIPKKEIIARIEEIKTILKLDDCINKDINQLSNIERVKVLIATAIVHKPKIIFLDNLFDGLNDRQTDEIFSILNEIKKNITVVITSSNLDNILKFDEVIVIGKKDIFIQDIPRNVLKNDNELAKLGLVIPPMIDLSLKLGFYGVIDDIVLDVDRMVEVLWK